MEDVIPVLVDEHTNSPLTLIPSVEEIKNAVFALNGDSAPVPDGFGGFFFHTYWSIVKQDLINDVQYFFCQQLASS